MTAKYTDEPHAQIVIALLKAHGVKKIVVSPGATNIPIVASVQNDSFFEVFSSVDERSAAYLACGLAEESGEKVAISCTGATASRNYMSGLTEAFYRKLPIISITSFNGNKFVGNLMPQNIDRTVLPKDIAKISVQLPVVKDESDFEYCSVLVNKAILETTKDGGGPVHINLTTTYKGTFTTSYLPEVRVIKRISQKQELLDLDNKKIAIFIGSHKKFTDKEIQEIEYFCDNRQAVVLCDHTSSYTGKYKIQSSLVCSNFSAIDSDWKKIKPDFVIHLGETSGDYPSMRVLEEKTDVLRISEDGEVRDRGGNLKYIYHGTEYSFFNLYNKGKEKNNYYSEWLKTDDTLRNKVKDLKLPFSNIWIASVLSKKIPNNSYLNLAILNTLRSWNLFKLSESISSFSNVGGFGIDGCLSTLVGASLIDNSKLYYGIIGDLAFFYDINVIANRHVGNNLRILIVNNGCGSEFKINSHIGSQFGKGSDDYIAAGGHFGSGNNSLSMIMSNEERAMNSLAKPWADRLGFKYISATTKNDFNEGVNVFTDSSYGQSVIFECFTNAVDEDEALKLITDLHKTKKKKAIKIAKKILPISVIKNLKKTIQ
ncbi:TPA: thiamine pyrophosphate-binding protein [Photobacterium damselae]